MLIDKLEKCGRLLLWLTLSATIVLFLVGISKWKTETAKNQAELDSVKEELRKALVPKGPERLKLSDMGVYLSGLNEGNAEGFGFFTNVSSRSGFLCVAGQAKGPQQTSTSLPACVEVRPYSSHKITVQFVYREVNETCPKGTGCAFELIDVPDK